MKYVMYGVGLLGTTVCFIVLFFSLSMPAKKQEELDGAVSQAMESAFVKALEQGESEEEMVENFLSFLDTALAEKGDLMVEVYVADPINKIFRVSVELQYRCWGSGTKTISTERTIIYDGEKEG